MGCHTWYKKLVTNNQEEILEKVKDVIATSGYFHWYEVTNLKDLFESDEEWVQEIADYVYDSIDDLIEVDGVLGIYTEATGYAIDAPRIGNYPNIIITSADEMFKVMETGLIDSDGKHYHFYWNENRYEEIRNNIIEFFKEFPDGIIVFG